MTTRILDIPGTDGTTWTVVSRADTLATSDGVYLYEADVCTGEWGPELIIYDDTPARVAAVLERAFHSTGVAW